jgi:hypothetical protein
VRKLAPGDYGIALVSGAICFGPSSGNCSKDAFDNIVAFTVRDRVKGYDHVAMILSIKLDFDVQSTLLASSSKKRKIDVVLPNETELDKLFIATLEAGKDKNKNLLKLCGPNTSITPVLKVTVHGTCIDAGKISASAAAATCWVPMHVLTRQVVHMDLGPALALN